MDELKLKLTGRFMRVMFSKWMTRNIRKKFGYDIDIHFGELNIDSIDGETTIMANVEIKIDSDEFKRIVKDVTEGV